MIKYEKLENHVFVTKLAGFEHSKYIQYNETEGKVRDDDIPLVQGQNIRNGNFVEKYNYYISKEISDNLSRSKLDKICILIPYVGSNLGEVGIFYHPYDCHMASNIAKIELIDDYFDIEYLKYYLQSPVGQGYLFIEKQGSAQPNITMQSIRNTLVLDKSKSEQIKIAKILKEIDDKININHQINNTLEEMMKTLYQRWFLEFEFPNEEGKPYKSSGGEMVWNEELKQEIPEDWKNCKIKDLCDVISGYPFSKELYDSEGKYKLITIKNVQDEGINLNTDNNIKNIPEKMPNYCLLKPLNILMSLTGNVGRAGIMFSQNCLLNQRVAILKEKNEKYIPFIYSLFKNDYIRKKLENMSTGTSQLNLSPIETEKLNVPYNEIAIDNYSKITYPYILKIEKLLEENQRLTELRDYLLPMLMNGQINVDDVKV